MSIEKVERIIKLKSGRKLRAVGSENTQLLPQRDKSSSVSK